MNVGMGVNKYLLCVDGVTRNTGGPGMGDNGGYPMTALTVMNHDELCEYLRWHKDVDFTDSAEYRCGAIRVHLVGRQVSRDAILEMAHTARDIKEMEERTKKERDERMELERLREKYGAS